MKIGDSKPVGETRPVRPVAGRKTPYNGPSEGRRITDTTSVMGIPESELTPKVRDAIMALMQEVDRFRKELDAAKQRIQHLENLADHDTLTPVLNRRGFIREMNRVKSYADRYEAPATLVYFDLNDFKPVNDRHGHAAGDHVLQKTAELLVENTRDSDVVGRLGGDEFGVILVNLDQENASDKAQQLADSIAAQQYEFDGTPYTITASFGIYGFVKGEDLNQTLANADRAMYAAKHRGSRTDKSR